MHRAFGKHDPSDTGIPQPIKKKQHGNNQYKQEQHDPKAGQPGSFEAVGKGVPHKHAPDGVEQEDQQCSSTLELCSQQVFIMNRFVLLLSF